MAQVNRPADCAVGGRRSITTRARDRALTTHLSSFLSSPQNHDCELLQYVDSFAVALSVSKGRGSSYGMLNCMRGIGVRCHLASVVLRHEVALRTARQKITRALISRRLHREAPVGLSHKTAHRRLSRAVVECGEEASYRMCEHRHSWITCRRIHCATGELELCERAMSTIDSDGHTSLSEHTTRDQPSAIAFLERAFERLAA